MKHHVPEFLALIHTEASRGHSVHTNRQCHFKVRQHGAFVANCHCLLVLRVAIGLQ